MPEPANFFLLVLWCGWCWCLCIVICLKTFLPFSFVLCFSVSFSLSLHLSIGECGYPVWLTCSSLCCMLVLAVTEELKLWKESNQKRNKGAREDVKRCLASCLHLLLLQPIRRLRQAHAGEPLRRGCIYNVNLLKFCMLKETSSPFLAPWARWSST